MPPLNPINNSTSFVSRGPALSKINSFKRDWSDDEMTNSFPSSQDADIEWPKSPEARKPPPVIPAMSASQKRMALIQAALAEVADPPQEASGSKRSLAIDVDDESNGPSKKRALPWDADHTELKDKRRFKPPSATTSSTASTSRTAAPSNTSTLNIKQKIVLSNEQQQILKLVLGGKNIFFTGSAGTGKSVLLREIIVALRKKYSKSPDAVAITASTGIAACNIGGVTLHSFSGVGLGIEPAVELANKIKKNKKASGRWLRTNVLIIDEISMVDGELFDKLAQVACIMRKNTRAFGGIQLVVTGDFFQLPPVARGEPTFAFEAKKWSECVERTFNLTKVFRQKDPEFVDMLNEMRFGKLTTKSITKFKNLSREIYYNDGIVPTELFPRREDVERANTTRLYALPGETHGYTATDGGILQESAQREKLLSNFMAPKQLQLRINSQVMMIKNTDDTLVNGSMGSVIDFLDPASHAKGMTSEDVMEQDMRDAEKPKKKAGDAQVLKKYPMVRFAVAGGGYKDVLVQQETWKVELPNGEVQVSRSQLPLILSWAMSIHKSQGQTLEKVKVDLGRVFEKGQAYVALSRATSLQGLQVLNFDAAKVQAHPKVAKWSETLESFM